MFTKDHVKRFFIYVLSRLSHSERISIQQSSGIKLPIEDIKNFVETLNVEEALKILDGIEKNFYILCFYRSCAEGDINMAELFATRAGINYEERLEYQACKNGYLPLVKFLINYNVQEYHVDNLDCANWLLSPTIANV